MQRSTHGSFEQQHYRASGLGIVFWNTVYLEHATSTLRSHTKLLGDTLLQSVWEQINL